MSAPNKPVVLGLLAEAEKHVHRMYLAGDLEQPVYYKQLLVIAHDFAMHGETVPACRLIETISNAYIKDKLPEQVKEDPKFGVTVHELSEKLVELSVVDLHPVYYTHGTPAQA